MARPSKENQADWEAIRRQYQLGVKSNTQLALEYGVDKASIGRRAKKEGWVQNKTEEVQTLAQTILTQALCNNATEDNATDNATSGATVAFDVQVAAQTQANVVLNHRTGLRKLSSLRDKLVTHLDAAIDEMGSVEDIIAALGENGEAVAARVSKILGRSVIIDDLKKLAEIDEKLRKGEREAFGIKDEGERVATYEQMLERVAGLDLPEGA